MFEIQKDKYNDYKNKFPLTNFELDFSNIDNEILQYFKDENKNNNFRNIMIGLTVVLVGVTAINLGFQHFSIQNVGHTALTQALT